MGIKLPPMSVSNASMMTEEERKKAAAAGLERFKTAGKTATGGTGGVTPAPAAANSI